MTRKYDLIENYFEKIDTEDKAYWIGFLFADGCYYPPDGLVSVSLSFKDENFLCKFRDTIYPGCDRPLKYPTRDVQSFGYGTSNPICRLDIYSKRMSDDLVSHGCVQAKTFKTSFPCHIDDNLWSHFIRGVFDGDGSISAIKLKSGKQKNQSKVVITFTGFVPFLNQINEIISKECGLNPHRKIFHKNGTSSEVGSLSYNGIRQCIKIREYLYKDATIYMERKYDKFSQLGVGDFEGVGKLMVNQYDTTIKINADCYIDPAEHRKTGLIRCQICGKELSIQNTKYDVNKTIYCKKCYKENFVYENEFYVVNDETCAMKIGNDFVIFDSDKYEFVKDHSWIIVTYKSGKKSCLLLKQDHSYGAPIHKVLNELTGMQRVRFKDGNSLNVKKENLIFKE